MTKTPEKLLTADEVAEILQVSLITVYRRMQTGELPHIKLGHRQVRIKPEDLEAYIEAHRVTSTALSAGAGEPAESELEDSTPEAR
jgi:excisionase family DNA binding protein